MKVFVGKVIGTKMAKTAVISVERIVVHPLYKKRFKRDRKYQVHDEFGVKINDVVKFTASKPYSKTKKWRILEVVASNKFKISNPKKVTKAGGFVETISKVENSKLETGKKGGAK